MESDYIANLHTENDHLMADVIRLQAELEEARTQVDYLESSYESLMEERKNMLSLLNHYRVDVEKTQGQKEAELLAELVTCIDGRKWASTFCKFNTAMNEDVMIGWFCNAIMTGYDEALRRATKEKVNDYE